MSKVKASKEMLEVQDVGKELASSFGARNALLREMENIYFMTATKPRGDHIRHTVSTDGRNKVQGATRLLTATNPHFKVATDKNRIDVRAKASELETAASLLWSASNRVQVRKVEKELAHNGFLYDVIECEVVSTKDILESVKTGKNKGAIYMAERRAAATPFIFIPRHPLTSFPLYSLYGGLDAYYTREDVRMVDVMAMQV
jgi:hypothetical protein